MNLDNWQRRETIGATYSNAIVNRYYGYSMVPNAADTDPVFAIRKIAVEGTVETVSWNDNSFSAYSAKWSERAANFATPTGSLGLTYSGTLPTTFTWNRIAGCNLYKIEVRDADGFLYDQNGGKYYATTDRTTTAAYTNVTAHAQRFTQPGSYSIYVQAINAAGTLTATQSFTL